jgi:hypothetical protein
MRPAERSGWLLLLLEMEQPRGEQSARQRNGHRLGFGQVTESGLQLGLPRKSRACEYKYLQARLAFIW